MILAKRIWKPYNTYWDLGKAGEQAKCLSITRLLTQNIFSFYIFNNHFWILDSVPDMTTLITFSTSDNNVFGIAVWSSLLFGLCILGT